MQKNVTVKVPNELWINDFSQNLTRQFTYDGPDKIWIIVSPNNVINGVSTEQPVEGQFDPGSTVVEIDISTASEDKLIAATLLISAKGNHTYTYEDEINHDGSIYKKITNPLLSDYYTLRFGHPDGFFLQPLLKDTKNPLIDVAVARKQYVEKFAAAFEFDAPTTSQINAYLLAIDTYIASITTAYPWKYVSYDKNEIPKIPVSLVTVFNSLPDSI